MKQCPLNDEYKFRTKCNVSTCKMYTEKTPNRCLGIDTSFAANDKTLSDSELVMYKFPGKTQKEVATLRKRAVSRVQAVLALNKVAHHIRAHERPEFGLNKDVMRLMEGNAKQILKKGLRSKIFHIRHLNLEVWMLTFVLDPEYTNRVVPDFERFGLHLLFRWSPRELEIVAGAIKEARKYNGQGKV